MNSDSNPRGPLSNANNEVLFTEYNDDIQSGFGVVDPSNPHRGSTGNIAVYLNTQYTQNTQNTNQTNKVLYTDSLEPKESTQKLMLRI